MINKIKERNNKLFNIDKEAHKYYPRERRVLCGRYNSLFVPVRVPHHYKHPITAPVHVYYEKNA